MDNLVTTIIGTSPPNPGIPNPPLLTFDDPNFLSSESTRKYIFKINELVIGSATVSCANPQINVVNNYSFPCDNNPVGFQSFTNIGCRTIDVFDTQGTMKKSAAPGEIFDLDVGYEIYILKAGNDTLVVSSNLQGRELNSGGCSPDNLNLTTLPEEFGLFTIIYSICEGDTLTVPNPLRSFICNNPSGPAPPIGTPPPIDVIPQVINTTPQWQSNGEDNFSTNAGLTVSFYPKETTEFIGFWPASQCSGGTIPPLGQPVHYLVIVNNGVDCQTTENPTFLIEACVGEVVTIPSPVVPSAQTINACPGNRLFTGNSVAELAEPIFPNEKDLQVRIISEGNFQIEAMGGSGNYSTRDDLISCPELTYNFQVRLLDCPDFCAGVLPDPVCGVDGNTYISACEAERVGVAIATQGECDNTNNNCSSIVVNLQDGQILIEENPLDFFAVRPKILGDINVTFQLNNGGVGGFLNTQCSGASCSLPFAIPVSGGAKEYTLSVPLEGGTTCSYTIEVDNTCSNTGTIFFEHCDDGRLFYFLRTSDGRVYDPYFGTGITYEPVNGQQIKFDFVDANFSSPCSNAEKAITLTCLEIIEDTNQECFEGTFNRATVLPSPCEVGPPFLFITNTGIVLEPYFSNNNFALKAGQQVRYESTNLGISTRCSLASQTIAIDCIEETDAYVASTACNEFTGEVQIGTCDDGSAAVYIQSSTFDRFLVYLTDGVEFDFVDGQRVQFDYNGGTRFNTPCSNATRAGFITCITAIETSSEGPIGEEQFKKYPFLRNEISQYGCATVEVYDQGSYDFIFLRFGPTSGRLYLDDGTFYCGSTATYDCISAYGLGNPTSSFTCSNFDVPEREDRSVQFEPVGFTVYPNPTLGELTVQLPSTTTEGYHLYLHDLFGRTVHQATTAPDATAVNLDMREYEDGIYYIELRTAGMRGIQKVVKQGLK